ncbi:unnamed protein product [Owenia fusiformis]|uniref:Uncharacterized protein n=1 Tax=Owenia fusiformis TaxID=6347 RepID=A0A8J1TEL8_OWEFU|nr:unnamed protein product [Owenia fusiformis]
MLKKIIVVALLSVLAHRIFLIVRLLGFHITLYNHRPGPCRIVKGIVEGSEDMQTLKDGLTLITGGMKRFDDPSAVSEADGDVYLFDFNAPEGNAVKLEIKGDTFNKKTFNPHGISLYEDSKQGKVFVFVVNHHPEGDRIEKFTFDRITKTLTHLHSTNHETLGILNDVFAIDDTLVYATQYDFFRHRLLRKLCAYLTMKLGSVFFVDTTTGSVTTVATGFLLANGINASPDKKYIYVSHMGERS